MELSNIHHVAVWSFVAAAVLGAIAHHTRFCAVGAISDWLHFGDTARLRALWLAIGVAILGVQLLEFYAPIDLQQSVYLTTDFGWLGHLLGGLLFGIGMTLASGCAQRALVLAGGGNLKALVVLFVLAITAEMTRRGLLAPVRAGIGVTNIDLSRYGMADQSAASWAALLTGSSGSAALRTAVALVVGCGVLALVFSGRDFLRRFDQMLAGLGVGLAIVAGWYITGVIGRDAAAPVPLDSYSFVAPAAELLQYLTHTGSTLSFGVAAVLGVIFGSLLYAVATGKFRLEGFASPGDLAAHLAGGALMGFGGVVALGCTIGQGITGMSTLALGSALTLGAILFGAALAMRVQYHLLDRRGLGHALLLALADMCLLRPRGKADTV